MDKTNLKLHDTVDREEAWIIDRHDERRLLLKLDLFIMPLIMLVYLSCFLDRSNIGACVQFLIVSDMLMMA